MIKVDVRSYVDKTIKVNVVCGTTPVEEKKLVRIAQHITRDQNVDVNPEGDCKYPQSSYIIQVWGDVYERGLPDSYMVIDSNGAIRKQVEEQFLFKQFKQTDTGIYQLDIEQKSIWARYWYIFVCLMIAVYVIIGVVVFMKSRHSRRKK